MAPCIVHGFLCYYDACDCDNCTCCCVGKCDFLCIRYSECFACDAKPRTCGVSADAAKGDICKIGLLFCEIGLTNPTKICACARKTWCCYTVGALPCTPHYLTSVVCAYCCISCAPKCGCCVEPPNCPALNSLLSGESEPLAPIPMPMDRVPPAGSTTTVETLNPDGSRKVVTTIYRPDGSKTVSETIVAAPHVPPPPLPPPPEGSTYATAVPEVEAKAY